MRVAYVTESFPPAVNGVAHTAVRVAEQLLARGHQPLVIAPEPASGEERPDAGFCFPVVRVPSLPLAGLYPGFRVGLPGRHVARRFHGLLAEAGHPVGAEPSADPENPPPGRLAVAGWLATKGTAWVVRRSTDLVPALVAMAWADYRSGAGDGGEGGLAVDPLTAAQPPVAQPSG